MNVHVCSAPANSLFVFSASEWKSFLFFYVPATLHKILLDKYYVHAFLLVKAIRILLSTSISKERLKLAESLLKQFCKLMEEYYGIGSASPDQAYNPHPFLQVLINAGLMSICCCT